MTISIHIPSKRRRKEGDLENTQKRRFSIAPLARCDDLGATLDTPGMLNRQNCVDIMINNLCNACTNGLPPDHPSHTRIDGECRNPSVRKSGVRRRGGPHRDPAVPATASAEDRNPVSHDQEFDRDVGGGTPSNNQDVSSGEENVEENVEFENVTLRMWTQHSLILKTKFSLHDFLWWLPQGEASRSEKFWQ